MVIEKFKITKDEQRELRKFGISIGLVLALWGVLLFYRGKDCCLYFFIISAIFIFLSISLPVILKPIRKIFMTLAIFVSWLITRVILIVLFYLIVTPTGLLARLFGKDFLDLKFDSNADSYWIPKKQIKFKMSNYERQF
jgi:hypothetical protein